MRASPSGQQVPFLIVLLLVVTLTAGCFSQDFASSPVDPGTPRAIAVDVVATLCPEGYDNGREDNVCLAYNGQIPGPTWVFQEDENIQIVLRNHVPATLEALGDDAAGARHLADMRYTMHRHGLAQDACSDGVPQPQGTEVCDSSVGPTETVVYTFNTSFPGFWHYHDHGHTFTAEPANGPLPGHEAVERGLWGSFLVLPEGERTDRTFDLHLIEHGVNGGMGAGGTAFEGERFDLIVTGLSDWDWFWDVSLQDPSGDVVGSVVVGAGVSRGITVADAQLGAYTWHAAPVEPYERYRSVVSTVPFLGERPEPVKGTIDVMANEETPVGTPPAAREGGSPVERGERTYVIPFDFWSAGVDGLPLLEAYSGELLEFHVVRNDAFGHVFHLHGHTWEDPATGDLIDAVPMVPGVTERHSFNVVAGLDQDHVGDWLYHCHINVDAHMWSVLRVYPDSMAVEGPLEDLQVTVTNRQKAPVEDAVLRVRWDPHAPTDPTLETADDGTYIPADVVEEAPGVYRVQADLPPGASGGLAIESDGPDGRSVLRLTLLPGGTYEENRHVGLEAEAEGVLAPGAHLH